jgi:hypothetical protein
MRGLVARNTYDPDHFDPTARGSFNNVDGGSSPAAYGGVSAKPGQKMQVNAAMVNAALIPLNFELFNWMTSMIKILNPNYATGAYGYIPLLTYEGIAAVAGADGTVGFDAAGNCEIRGNTGAGNGKGTISCSTVPYRAFFEASAIIPFQVAYIRQTSLTDAQIDNQIVWFQKTFAGATTQNKISPRSYFKPNQFQPLTVDVTIGFPVGIDAGLNVIVNNGENLRYALFINYWTKQVI